MAEDKKKNPATGKSGGKPSVSNAKRTPSADNKRGAVRNKKKGKSLKREFSFRRMVRSKKVGFGAFSTLTVVVVIIALAVINLIFGQLGLQTDTTANQMFSLSTYTDKALANLSTDYTIYALFPAGSESNYDYKRYMEIIDQYPKISSKIHVVYKDMTLYPAFIHDTLGEDLSIETGSLIVQGNGDYKIITPEEFKTTAIDYTTYQTYDATLDIEQKITNSIELLESSQTYDVYIVNGHGEPAFSDALVTSLKFKGYNYMPISLRDSDIPANCSALIITTPQWDYTAAEAAKVKNYLASSGRALVIVGGTQSLEGFTNFNDFLSEYGVKIQYMQIVEGDTANEFGGKAYAVMPLVDTHDITTALTDKSIRPLVLSPQNIAVVEPHKVSLTFEKLLETSDKAFGKLTSDSVNKESGDATGPFTIGMAITDDYTQSYITYITKLVVYSSDTLIDDTLNQSVYDANSQLIVGSFDWLIDKNSQTTYIPPKNLTNTLTLTLSGAQQRNIKIIALGVMPGVVFVAGIIVWARRRHK